MTAFDTFLADVEAEREWLLELDALPLNPLSSDSAAFGDGGFEEFAFEEDTAGETGGAVKLYYSSHGYASVVGADRDYLSLGSADDGAWASLDLDFVNHPDVALAEWAALGGTFSRAGATASAWALVDRYMHLPGYAGSRAKALVTTGTAGGAFECVCKVAPDDWTPSAPPLPQAAFRLLNDSSVSFTNYVSQNGRLNIEWWDNTATYHSCQSTADLSALAGGAIKWLKISLVPDNGAGSFEAKFWTSDDYDPDLRTGTWVQLGATVTGAASNRRAVAGNVTYGFGGLPSGGAFEDPASGKFYYAEYRTAIDGPAVYVFDARRWRPGDVANVAATGETWQLDGNAYIVGAELQTIAADTLRVDYDPSTLQSRGYLNECETRTCSFRNNTMQGAIVGTPGTLPTNWVAGTPQAGLAREVVGFGREAGIDYIDLRWSGVSTGGTVFITFDSVTRTVAAQNDYWALSCYFRLVAGVIPNFNLTLSASDAGGADIGGAGATAVAPTGAPLYSQRAVKAGQLTAATTAFVRPYVGIPVVNGVNYDFTLRIGLPQVEKCVQNLCASSPIRTTNADTTRNADSFSEDGLGFYNAAEGSIYTEWVRLGDIIAGQFPRMWSFWQSSAPRSEIDFLMTSTPNASPEVWVAGAGQNFGGYPPAAIGAVDRNAVRYKVGDGKMAHNGVLGAALNIAALPAPTRLAIGRAGGGAGGGFIGYLRRLTYFHKALVDATLTTLSTSGPVLLRRTVYGEDPASLQWYDGRIAGEPTVRRSVIDGQSAQGGLAGGLGGLVQCFAEIELVNADGGLDELAKSYALDGRAVRLYLGRPTDKRADFGVVFAGVNARTPLTGSKVATLSLSDGLARLLVPLNSSAYGGTGGLDGDTDLAGKPKPKCWGSALNVAPPLVDNALLIYQVHDGLANAVTMVYDRAVALTAGADYATQNDLLTVAPAAGQYRVWKDASGTYFRLGASPDGTVTADVQGDATGGYVNTTGDIVNRVLQIVLEAAEIDAAAIAQLNLDAPAVVGIWRGTDAETVAGVVSQLLVGVGAFGGFNRSGLFTCAVIGIGAATVDAFTEEEIGDVEREALPDAIEPIVWRTRVAWQRNNTVQTDVAAGVDDARRAFVAQAERVAERNEPATKSRRRLAKEYGPNGELYATEADAQAEADRRLALFGVDRGLYTLPLPARAMSRDIGETIEVTYPRFGLSGGVNALILEHQIVGDEVTVKVLV